MTGSGGPWAAAGVRGVAHRRPPLSTPLSTPPPPTRPPPPSPKPHRRPKSACLPRLVWRGGTRCGSGAAVEPPRRGGDDGPPRPARHVQGGPRRWGRVRISIHTLPCWYRQTPRNTWLSRDGNSLSGSTVPLAVCTSRPTRDAVFVRHVTDLANHYLIGRASGASSGRTQHDRPFYDEVCHSLYSAAVFPHATVGPTGTLSLWWGSRQLGARASAPLVREGEWGGGVAWARSRDDAGRARVTTKVGGGRTRRFPHR